MCAACHRTQVREVNGIRSKYTVVSLSPGIAEGKADTFRDCAEAICESVLTNKSTEYDQCHDQGAVGVNVMLIVSRPNAILSICLRG